MLGTNIEADVARLLAKHRPAHSHVGQPCDAAGCANAPSWMAPRPHPANGQPIIVPSQDIVLGIYYLTRDKAGAKGEGRVFASGNEVLLALDADSAGKDAMLRSARFSKVSTYRSEPKAS